MSDGWAALASITRQPVPYHDGYAPNPPAQLAPFVVDGPAPMVVDRAAALTVPAYVRGRSLIAATVASFPLDEYRDGARLLPPRQLLTQPDPATTRGHTLRCTVEDLVDYGRAWWLVVDRDSETGKPRHVQHVEPGRVRIDRDGTVLVDSAPVRARDLIRFDHDRVGALDKGARILATALALESASARYARAPAPRTILRGTGPVHLNTEQARELIDEYERTVSARGAAYVDAVELDQVGWSSAELQLVEARRHTAAQIANLLNIDATWLGAAESGSSLTYTNRVDLVRSLVDLTLRGYLDTIEQRLSLDDVTERGRVIRWNLDGFLRGNAAERAALVAQLLPLDVMDRAEARQLVDLQPDPEVVER